MLVSSRSSVNVCLAALKLFYQEDVSMCIGVGTGSCASLNATLQVYTPLCNASVTSGITQETASLYTAGQRHDLARSPCLPAARLVLVLHYISQETAALRNTRQWCKPLHLSAALLHP